MKKHLTFTALLTFATLVSFAQKHVDLYRAGVFDKSYSTLDSAFREANFIGDSIVLSAHTFYETLLDYPTKIIPLQGTVTSTDTTVMDASAKDEFFIRMRGTGSIRDIIFQNGKNSPLVLKGPLSTDTMIIGGNCIFRDFNLSKGYPIINDGVYYTILEDNVKIYNNTCETIARTFFLDIKDNVLIANNFGNPDNISDSPSHIGIVFASYALNVTGNVKIINNSTDSAMTAGVSIWHYGEKYTSYIGDSVTIANNISNLPNGKGGGICIFKWLTYSHAMISKTITIGAAMIANNQATEGGGIYCNDTNIRIVMKGTRFVGNKAKRGGAIFHQSGMDIKDANFEDNEADSGASIFINSKVGASPTPFLSVSTSRFYNRLLPANKQNHIFATYTPLTAIPPSINLNGNWWGKSDTIGVLREIPKGLSNLGFWAVANWSVKGGSAVVAGDTTFPVAAEIKYNHGIAFAPSSFGLLKGIFKTDTGTFTPTVAPINSSNMVSSTFHTYKDSALTSTTAHFVASIDADTFRKTQIVWSKDTLTTTASILGKELPEITMYPNPVGDMLHLSNVPKGSSVSICDLQGRGVLRSDNLYDLYVGHLAAGSYIVSIVLPDGSVGTAKLVKE